MPNVLSNDLVARPVAEPEGTIRTISEVTGNKSLVLGILRNVPLQLAERFVNLDFLVVDGSPYDVIIVYISMEGLRGVLVICNMLASFTIDDEVIQVPMEPDYVYVDVDKKDGKDSDDFTSASSAALSPEQSGGEEK